MKVNIGTYSFGMQSDMSLAEKLKKAKEIGYDGIEFLANDFKAHSVDEIKKMLDDNGLMCVSTHAQMGEVADLIPKIAELGGKFVIVASHAFANKEEALDLAKLLNENGEIAKKYGIKVGYHNHSSEFFVDEGKPILEYVIENTDPETVGFQIDCGWATAAGADCPEFIKKYSGRIISVHVKENNTETGTGQPRSAKEPRPARPPMEIGPDGKPIMSEEMKKMIASMRERTKIQCPMGDPSSRVDWKAIRAATEAQGIGCEWTVERENDYLDNIVKCLEEDCTWLKANLQ